MQQLFSTLNANEAWTLIASFLEGQNPFYTSYVFVYFMQNSVWYLKEQTQILNVKFTDFFDFMAIFLHAFLLLSIFTHKHHLNFVESGENQFVVSFFNRFCSRFGSHFTAIINSFFCCCRHFPLLLAYSLDHSTKFPFAHFMSVGNGSRSCQKLGITSREGDLLHKTKH